jgi:hypothetical protein
MTACPARIPDHFISKAIFSPGWKGRSCPAAGSTGKQIMIVKMIMIEVNLIGTILILKE